MTLMSAGETHTPHRPLTVEDLRRMPDDGRRYELVEGRLDVSPAPLSVHTLIESRLMVHLGVNAPDDFMVLTGPGLNLNAEGTHHRIPDLAVIRAEDFEKPYLTRPPLLAVEVVSPESVFRDHHTRLREYAEFGIASYWIVNPSADKPGIAEFRLDGDRYVEHAQVFGENVLATDVPFPVRTVPHWLLADGPWRQRIGGAGTDAAD
ncbi:Uma2 family endonuclease [Thermobifida halotolerans]|uniref:Uma2 family endonuclease n=1 Tax=Thermobifida halotolerans TaxID=483545 RepID=A0AA97M3L6_9ACTN|nr:Uma2 family endonuclease [Thermobifida halotolerans]UOE19283.1 Uma2 family endonuclease [Thermobifida halotolerans]